MILYYSGYNKLEIKIVVDLQRSQACPNDITIRNMLPIAIWSFFTKLETDVSKAQYVFTERVFYVYVWWSD